MEHTGKHTAISNLVDTIRRWQAWIINFLRDHVTTGVTAGINNKSKVLKRVAYSLPNFAHLQARLLMEFTSAMASPL